MKKIVTLLSAMLLCSAAFASAPDWNGSRWIAMDEDVPFNHFKYFHGAAPATPEWENLGKFTLPQFRTEFECKGKVASARLYVCGLGQFDLYLNGEKVGDHFMDPGWTQFDKEVLYVEFDVKDLLKEKNAVGVMLGGGFYNIPNERYHKCVGSMGAPKMRLVLDIEYEDGSKARVCSDGSWKVDASAVVFSSIYGGEDFDATKEQAGWKEAGFDDSAWKAPLEVDFNPLMLPQENDPLKVRTVITPISVTRNAKGWLYDCGQNFSGIFSIKVSGKPGQTVRIFPSELLKDGLADQSSGGGYGDYTCYFNYTIGSESEEYWHPQFMYYGQRYFQIEGAVPAGEDNPDGLPEVTELLGLHTCASSPEVGSFKCSNELFNTIDRLAGWSLRSNMASVITDCPHREKLGWSEQAQLMFAANEYKYRLINVYRNQCRQLATAQREDGCIPTIAPEYVRFVGWFEDTPEWGSALIMVPWYCYKWYGDDSLFKEYYPVMKKYLEYLKGMKDDRGLVAYGLGDWLTVGTVASPAVTAHITYCQDLQYLSQMADLQGFKEDKAYFDGEYAAAVAAFNEKLWDPEKQVYDTDSQTVNAMALWVGIVPEDRQEKVYQNLLDNIEERNYAVGVGEVAHPYLLSLLHARGDDDVIFKMHTQREQPGYAYFIDRGATALAEAWDGGFSQNHFCLGHIIQWFYGSLAGIGQQEGDLGWKNILIAPKPVGDVTWVDCDFDSPAGMISSHWKIKGKRFIIKGYVPEGSTATVVLPSGKTVERGPGKFRLRCKMTQLFGN